MHVLFIAPTLPIPTSGGRTRLFNLVKQIAQRHEVSVLCFIQPGEESMLPQVSPFCRRLVTVPFAGPPPQGAWRNRLLGWMRILFDRLPRYARTFPVERMRQPLRTLLQLETFDVVVLQDMYVVELASELAGLPRVLGKENVESEIASRAMAGSCCPVHRLRDWLIWRKLLAYERRWVRRFAVCTAVSETDAGLLKAMSPKTEVLVVPNGVDCAHFAPPPGERSAGRLLFFGVLDYAANQHGLAWFCEQVLPRVRRVHPDATLEICGLHQSLAVTALAKAPGVQLTGFVPDIRPKLWQSRASVVPLHYGGGTRLKILEALAAGCPVVSTSAGAEGLDLERGEHLLIADSPEEFARCLTDLLSNDGLCQRLSEAGRGAVARRYDWSGIACSLEAACERAVVEFRSR